MVENAFEIIVSLFRVLLGTIKQRPGCHRHCVCACGVAQHEAKHQQDLLKYYFNQVGALAGQEDRICQPTTLGAETGIYQSFSGLPNFSKNFYLS